MARRKRKPSYYIPWIVVGATILLATFLFGRNWWLELKASRIRYKEFGIPIPTGYSLHGIDVSRYQQTINWGLVKAMNVGGVQIHFAFIKATEGNDNDDDYFKRNWKKAKEAGITRGAYHFFIASKDGTVQAHNFMSKVKIEPGDLPPVLDVEQTNGVSPQILRQRVKAWLVAAELAYGVKPIIYTNVDFYKRFLGSEFDDYPLWAAHYLQPDAPRISRNWHFWQHSEKGKVNGVAANVDFNVFYGDSIEFTKLLIK
jgi:lysozyme